VKGKWRYPVAFLVACAFEFLLLSFSEIKFPEYKKEPVQVMVKLTLFEQKEPKKVGVKPKVVSKRKKIRKKLPSKGKKKQPSEGLKPKEGNLPKEYVELVRKSIEENIFYPEVAYAQGIEGLSGVEFEIDSSGKVLNCKIVSGNEILGKATCTAVKRSDIPPLPSSVKAKKVGFQLFVRYSLESVKKWISQE
jgi:TonB family protein